VTRGSWEAFDEWVNLDKATPAMLKWEGELPGAEVEEEGSQHSVDDSPDSAKTTAHVRSTPVK